MRFFVVLVFVFCAIGFSEEANIRSRRIENGWDGSDGWSSWNDWNGGNGWNGWNGWNAGNGWNVGNVENGWNVGNGWNMLDCGIIKGLVNIDMKTLFSQPLPRWRIEKCFAACVGEVVGIIKDRRIDPDGVAALASRSYNGDSLRVEIARGIANECSDITDSDRCEASSKIMECMHRSVESRGFTSDDL